MPRPDWGFLGFAALFFVFHQAWVVLGVPVIGITVSVMTPFAIVAATVVVLRALDAQGRVVLFAIFAGTMYVYGRGAHVAANSIQNEINAPIVTFWDERFGHIVGVLGWVGLVVAFCLAERAGRRLWEPSPAVLAVAGGLFGWTTFTATVEGRTWWLQLAATAVFVGWALRSPRPLLRTAAGAFLLGALLIGAWAVWHGGVPQLSTA